MTSIRDASGKASPPHSTSHGSRALPLACRECQRKKTRCDRTYPCTPCTRAGIPCVPSTRKPRAKTGTKGMDAELRSRIAKLERLVESFQGEEMKDGPPGVADSSHDEDTRLSTPQSMSRDRGSLGPTSPNTTKYIAGSFWSSLTAEVQALREVFDEEDAQSEGEGGSSELTPSSNSQPLDLGNAASAGYELIFCPPGSLFVMPGALREPEGLAATALWEDFLRHVEPMYKLFHVPTLRAFFEHGQPLYGRDPDAVCNKALRAAIYFSAAVSMTEPQCQLYFGKPRDEVAQDFRRYVDISLYAADPLNTVELATLQAMVLYVSSVRILDNSRRAWSLMGLVVRIARAMNLHRENPGESIYNRELRRRVWHNLVFLDCYYSIDRGSEPAIHPDSFTRELPLHVNDVDFGPETTSLEAREGELTDMSLALMTQDGADVVLRLSIPEELGNGETWQQRLELAYSYQRNIQARYLRYCDPSIPLQKLMIGIGFAASHSMILRAVRPMQYHLSSVPPRVDSPWVLQLAVNILRHCDTMWNDAEHGGWRRIPWVPWHAIAVALAGLCSIRGTDLANEAWHLVDRSMVFYAPNVADSRTGLLWKPIERLRRKALAYRDQVQLDTAAGTAGSTPASSHLYAAATEATATAAPAAPPELQGAFFDTTFSPNTALQDASFNFPPDMLATLPPADASWFDWESMMKDMGDVNYAGF